MEEETNSSPLRGLRRGLHRRKIMREITLTEMEKAVTSARPKYLKSKEHEYYVRMGYTRRDQISFYWEGKDWENAVFSEFEMNIGGEKG